MVLKRMKKKELIFQPFENKIKSQFLSIFVSEMTPKFKRKLEDKRTKEKDSVLLECELNKPNIPVRWLKNGEELQPSDRIQIKSDNFVHQLIIDNATIEDGGTYTCVCGSVSTDATLTIDGM